MEELAPDEFKDNDTLLEEIKIHRMRANMWMWMSVITLFSHLFI